MARGRRAGFAISLLSVCVACIQGSDCRVVPRSLRHTVDTSTQCEFDARQLEYRCATTLLGTYAATDVTATFTVATRYDSVDAFVEEGALPGRVRSTHIEVTADVSDGWIRAATWNGCAYPGTAPFWLQGTSCVLTPQSWDNEYSDDTRPLSVLGLEVHDWDDQLRPTAVASQAPCAASDSTFVFDPVVSSVVTVHATTFASGTEPGCSPVSQDFALHTGNWQLAPCTTFDVCL